jgi:hypothetical protein
MSMFVKHHHAGKAFSFPSATDVIEKVEIGKIGGKLLFSSLCVLSDTHLVILDKLEQSLHKNPRYT